MTDCVFRDWAFHDGANSVWVRIMKRITGSIPIYCLALCLSIVNAAPVISSAEWRPACEGSEIEVVSEQKKILGLRASAVHSAVIIEWSVHFMNGKPVSAEFRELTRGKILKGENAGEYSGDDTLKRVETWTWTGDESPIKDEKLAKDFADILNIARKQAEQADAPAKAKPEK